MITDNAINASKQIKQSIDTLIKEFTLEYNGFIYAPVFPPVIPEEYINSILNKTFLDEKTPMTYKKFPKNDANPTVEIICAPRVLTDSNIKEVLENL